MSENVFLDLGFSEDEAAGLKLRSYLFIALQEIIRKRTYSETTKRGPGRLYDMAL